MPATHVEILGVKLDATGSVAQLSQPDGNYEGQAMYGQPFLRDTGVINIWNYACDATFNRTGALTGGFETYVLTGSVNKNANRVESGAKVFGDVPQEFIVYFNDEAVAPGVKWTYDFEITPDQPKPPHFWRNDENVVGSLDDEIHYFGNYHVPMANAQSTQSPVAYYLPQGVNYRLKIWGVKTIA